MQVSDDDRIRAVLATLAGQRSAEQVASELHVPLSVVEEWRDAFLAGGKRELKIATKQQHQVWREAKKTLAPIAALSRRELTTDEAEFLLPGIVAVDASLVDIPNAQRQSSGREHA
jgi:hypothetical protein